MSHLQQWQFKKVRHFAMQRRWLCLIGLKKKKISFLAKIILKKFQFFLLLRVEETLFIWLQQEDTKKSLLHCFRLVGMQTFRIR